MLAVGGTGTDQRHKTNRVDRIRIFAIFPMTRKAARDKALVLSNDMDDLINSLDGSPVGQTYVSCNVESPVTAGSILITHMPAVESSV